MKQPLEKARKEEYQKPEIRSEMMGKVAYGQVLPPQDEVRAPVSVLAPFFGGCPPCDGDG